MNNDKKRIAYIVSMGAGLEALYAGGKKIVIYATRFKKSDVFSPREDWPYEYVSMLGLALLPQSVTIHAHEFYTNPNSVLFRKALNNAYKFGQWHDEIAEVPRRAGP